MTTYENLIYPTLDSYDTIQNILLIDQSVIQSQVFYDNANLTSYPIVYNSLTKREDLSQLLSRFTHLDRIAFVFHGIYPGCYYDKPFLEEQPFFTLDGSGTVIDSENISFVQSLISTFTVSHVDFLGCNLLLSEEWLKYFDILRANSDCVVGASNDNTGNLKYGGDWVLENTMEDVRNVYFTSGLDSYSGLLVTTAITTSVTLTDSAGTLSDGTTSYPWSGSGYIPITGNNIIVRFGGSINITTGTQFFQINGNNVTVDGGNNIVSLNATGAYPGLFASSSYGNITIQNIVIKLLSNATHGGGSKQAWLTSFDFAAGQPNILISNCGITGTPKVGSSYGGLLTSTAQCTLIGCYNTSNDCSVICASSAIPTIRRLINCWNSGNVTGQSGGIIGTNSTATYISGCYNTGNIILGGGILPSGAMANFQGNATVINCYNSGRIYSGGGITGINFGQGTGSGTTKNIINVQNCYNVGTVNSSAYGLIGSFNGSLKTINISNCYNYSSRPAINTANGGTTTVNISNVYSNSTWSDSFANATGNLINTPSSVSSPGTVWTSIAANTPYLLSSITGNLYSPNTASTQLNTFTTGTPIYGNNFTLLSVNSANPTTYATINATSGVISFSNLIQGVYNARVISYFIRNSQYSNYEFTTFQLAFSLPPALYPANTYNHTFYTYSNANPTVLNRTVYNDAGVQQSSTDITFGGQTIQAALSALDSETSSFTIGVKDTSNNKISMDLAFFGAYSSILTPIQQNTMISYVNTNYKEPHTSATTYVVTVSNDVFYLNGVARPNITFVSGNLYVFDQSSPTNIGNLLVLGTTVDVSSSVVGNNVVYNGTPGSVNAYTLIDFGRSNPATITLKYFSSTNTGMGSV